MIDLHELDNVPVHNIDSLAAELELLESEQEPNNTFNVFEGLRI